ncbi:conserved exported protein of unknown function [Nitrospira japonica]|uniref:Uncharacterized protein n=1 Tax=Nitrospira japonica TaxID=1325564 RepID=A0A1W1I378_9BACT|nr:hypothetical protein [Nitrospira japonica]SLM47460.1 conserved exported protein of unknown function [Nitrospira japonica]
MRHLLLSLSLVGAVACWSGAAHAANPMSDKEASPTLGERLTKDTVSGTLMKMEGEYYWIKDNDGKETRIHVDKSSKIDKVVVGDHVKAYVTDRGHTTTLQRAD